MKKFLSALTFTLEVAVFIPTMTCQASSVPVTKLKEIIGNWYDTKGNLVLTIGNDYKVNGCKVVALYLNPHYQPIFTPQSSAIYTCKIADGSGYRDIHLDYHSMPSVYLSTSDYHETIFLNGNIALRRTKEPRYFESVGGIYLGMNKDQVLRLYGSPSNVIERNNGRITWKYDKQKFDIWFSADIVDSITIYKSGDRRFDWSRLSANNTRAEFKSRYGGKAGQLGESRGPWIIGYGESINFRNDSVTLSIDW